MTYKQVAIDAAKEAGEVLLSLSKKNIKFDMKNSYDIIAEGDLKSEQIIIDKIKSHFPSHSILSEEAGQEVRNTDYLWIIDPVDGTINYSRHIEEYCISIALREKGQLILGVIYQPALGKLYLAEQGQGAFLNGKRLSVSNEEKLINSVIATDVSSKIDARKATFNALNEINNKVRHIRIFGSSALHLARLAEGQIDVYFKHKINYWDCAAGILMVEESGGVVTDFKNNPINESSNNILVSNRKLHQQIRDLL